MAAQNTAVLPTELWDLILDKVCDKAGLWAGKAMRKIGRVCQAFAVRARTHSDNIVPVLQPLPPGRRWVLDDSDDDSDDEMGEPLD